MAELVELDSSACYPQFKFRSILTSTLYFGNAWKRLTFARVLSFLENENIVGNVLY